MPSKPQIAFYGLWPELHTYTKNKLPGQKIFLASEKIDAATLDPNIEILAAFIDSKINQDIISQLPRLRYIAAMSTGYDHIDLAAAKKRGIAVSNVPTYGENTVAEHTFALIIGLTRKLFQSVKRVKEGIYDFHGLRGVDLKGKTLGVIGTGHIGTHVIRIAQGFGMNVIATDKQPSQQLAKELQFTYTTLTTLLKTADIITLHAPLSPQTKHLINKENIKLIKPGSYLINTARGALIDPEALLWALNNNILSGAGLDVLEDENLLQDVEQVMHNQESACHYKTSLINNLIIDHPNTIVTPHNAFNSTEALQRIVDITTDNIASFIAGEIKNLVS